LWDPALFSFADLPCRLKPPPNRRRPKSTLAFDEAAPALAHERARRIGSDRLPLCDDNDEPVLATTGETLAVILLAWAGSLVPGGGLWLHTQRRGAARQAAARCTRPPGVPSDFAREL
jgi:hypothetical protein